MIYRYTTYIHMLYNTHFYKICTFQYCVCYLSGFNLLPTIQILKVFVALSLFTLFPPPPPSACSLYRAAAGFHYLHHKIFKQSSFRAEIRGIRASFPQRIVRKRKSSRKGRPFSWKIVFTSLPFPDQQPFH